MRLNIIIDKNLINGKPKLYQKGNYFILDILYDKEKVEKPEAVIQILDKQKIRSADINSIFYRKPLVVELRELIEELKNDLQRSSPTNSENVSQQ